MAHTAMYNATLKDGRHLSVAALHALRTPLTAIAGYAETLLHAEVQLPEEVRREFLEAILSSAKRMAELTDQAMDGSLRERDHQQVTLAPTPVRPMLRRAAAATRRMTALHRVTWAADSPTVLADESRLQDVLVELVSNAVKYSPEGSVIRVGVRTHRHSRPCKCGVKGAHAVITVRDDGIGIRAEEHHHIFRPYYRVPGEETKRVPGEGLGLYLCRCYVEAMGGRIAVVSSPRRGSMFCLALPLVEGGPQG